LCEGYYIIYFGGGVAAVDAPNLGRTNPLPPVVAVGAIADVAVMEPPPGRGGAAPLGGGGGGNAGFGNDTDIPAAPTAGGGNALNCGDATFVGAGRLGAIVFGDTVDVEGKPTVAATEEPPVLGGLNPVLLLLATALGDGVPRGVVGTGELGPLDPVGAIVNDDRDDNTGDADDAATVFNNDVAPANAVDISNDVVSLLPLVVVVPAGGTGGAAIVRLANAACVAAAVAPGTPGAVMD
jgi:hypothetical protein